MTDTRLFSRELTVFEKHRKNWSSSHPGEYVAVQDDVIVEGFFSTYGEALKAGLKQFGARRSFLVKADLGNRARTFHFLKSSQLP